MVTVAIVTVAIVTQPYRRRWSGSVVSIVPIFNPTTQRKGRQLKGLHKCVLLFILPGWGIGNAGVPSTPPVLRGLGGIMGRGHVPITRGPASYRVQYKLVMQVSPDEVSII